MNDAFPDDEWSGDLMEFTSCCSQCRSTHVEPRNLARHYGGAIGAIVGTTGGVAAAVASAEAGVLGGPIGVLLGAAVGVVIDGIVGGATDCAAGSRLGETIDRSILHNHRCRTCGHTFGDTSR
ncbi:hypothetical protein ABQJ54_11055 [Rhodanobacter sp. Si-c]|uniref:Glycine zipper domain-containing protein n=1 Tax=Rhodanobacter lycopersici TaxID=3162487 RepID=A0ABV3QEV8_9GAMM